MEEQVITFETAKLAKEKGFNIGCHMVYDESRKITDTFRFDPLHFNFRYIHISAPTQSLLQKWLREIHNIEVEVFRTEAGQDFKYGCQIEIWNDVARLNDPYNDYGYTYEEALEAGLYEALKLIK